MQTQIQFNEIIQVLDGLKKARREGLHKTGIFSDSEMDFLLKITYDLTDKDFEYFVAILLEKDGYKTIVQGGFNDHGIDILASKDGQMFAIQCKQWTKSCISMKNVGDYYGTIYYEKDKNPDKIFAYVTTSYIQPEAEKFLLNHGIQGIISNFKLVHESKRLGFFSEDGWKALILEIRRRRMQEISKNPQLSFETGYEKLKKELRTARLSELKHHLPKSIRYKHSVINPIQHKEFLASFFQYWNLV